jgi:hypothetical protein
MDILFTWNKKEESKNSMGSISIDTQCNHKNNMQKVESSEAYYVCSLWWYEPTPKKISK